MSDIVNAQSLGSPEGEQVNSPGRMKPKNPKQNAAHSMFLLKDN